MTNKEIINPCIVTQLTTDINIKPSLLNNNLYNNIKEEVRKLEGRCYKNYGYISDIQKIISHDQGLLINEDNDGNVRFNVTFQCKLYRPLENTLILAKVEQKSDILSILSNGPIKIFIKLDELSDTNINFNDLTIGMYVKVLITQLHFYNKEKYITAIGKIQDINVSDDLIGEYFATIYE